jgi:hypothetical protein
MKGADSYVRSDADNKYVVLSGGSGWAPTGAAMVLRGAGALYNPHGAEIYTGNAESMKIDMLGNVTIGSGAVLPLTPKLSVNGAVAVGGDINSTGSITATGQITATEQITSNYFLETKSGGVIFPDGTIQTTAALGSGGSGGGIPDVILQHSVAGGVDGGAMASENAWVDRPINRIIRNKDGLTVLSGNQFSLPAGSYFVQWISSGCHGFFKSRLLNQSNGAVLALGSSVRAWSGSQHVSGESFGATLVNLNETSWLRLQQIRRSGGNVSGNLGCAQQSDGREIHAQVFISKVTSESVVNCAAMGAEPLEYLGNGYGQGCRWRNPTRGGSLTAQFTVPSGVGKIKVYAIGGGGGSGHYNNSFWTGHKGGGGGAAIREYPGVSAGMTFNFTAGAGGQGGKLPEGGQVWGANGINVVGANGEDSTFDGPEGLSIVGKGGIGGNNGYQKAPGGGALGGETNCDGGIGDRCDDQGYEFNCFDEGDAPTCEGLTGGFSGSKRGGGGASTFGGDGANALGCGGGGAAPQGTPAWGSNGCIVILWN